MCLNAIKQDKKYIFHWVNVDMDIGVVLLLNIESITPLYFQEITLFRKAEKRGTAHAHAMNSATIRHADREVSPTAAS